VDLKSPGWKQIGCNHRQVDYFVKEKTENFGPLIQAATECSIGNAVRAGVDLRAEERAYEYGWAEYLERD
jgi:hypothetical protein